MRLFLLLLLLLPETAFSQVVQEYDEDTGATTYSTEKPVPIDSEMPGMDAMYKPFSMDGKWGMDIYYLADFDGVVGHRDEIATFYKDGKQAVLNFENIEIEPSGPHLIISGSIFMSRDEFVEIANSDSVRFKIGSVATVMPKPKREAMRTILRRLSKTGNK